MAISDKLKKFGKKVKEEIQTSKFHKSEKSAYKSKKKSEKTSGYFRKESESYDQCVKRFTTAHPTSDGLHPACKLPSEYKKSKKPTRKETKEKYGIGK